MCQPGTLTYKMVKFALKTGKTAIEEGQNIEGNIG